jgi:hypothetical protein
MNYGLLWLAALFIALLWVAALVACVARLRRKWVRIVLMVLVLLVPLAPLGAFVYGSAAMKFGFNLAINWFNYALSLLVVYLVGAALILSIARRREAGLRPAAASWRPGPLILAWLVAVAMGYLTLTNMDLAVRARCALLSVKANSLYLATLPAIVSEEQNAAPLYEKAIAQLKQDPGLEINNPPLGNNEKFDPNEPATIDFLKRHAATIAMLRKAAAMPACRFDQDLMDPDLTNVLPGLNDERAAANVLNLHAREAVAHGQAAEAIADAQALFAMSRHFGYRPLIVSALVAWGIDAVANKTLEMALPTVKHPEELAPLQLQKLPPLGRLFRQSLLGEERWGLAIYGNLPEAIRVAPGQSWNTALLPAQAGVGGSFFRVFCLNVNAYVAFMEDVQHWAVQPYYKIRGQLPGAPGVKGSSDLLVSILAPSLSPLFETLGKAEAADACAHVAVAMTHYRLDRGALPAKLNELVPKYLDAIPADPFDGKPLRLAVKDKQWIIYSVGPDGVDDGGADLYATNAKRKGDIIFTLKP